MGTHTATVIAARDAAFAAMKGGFRLLDLTEVLGPDSVMWPGAPEWSVEDVVTFEGGGYHARMVHTFEHAGTHLDAPGHLVPGAGDVASLPIEDLVVPVVVIDITEKAAAEPNSVVTAQDVEDFEAAHGRIPAGSAVLMNSGWARRNHDVVLYSGTSTTTDLQFPGFGLDGAAALVERGVVGIGVDTLGIDPGNEPSLPVHREVTHPAGLWHLENLVNVDLLPPTGAVLAVGVPRIHGGTGFPCRAFAFVPKD